MSRVRSVSAKARYPHPSSGSPPPDRRRFRIQSRLRKQSHRAPALKKSLYGPPFHPSDISAASLESSPSRQLTPRRVAALGTAFYETSAKDRAMVKNAFFALTRDVKKRLHGSALRGPRRRLRLGSSSAAELITVPHPLPSPGPVLSLLCCTSAHLKTRPQGPPP